ncbi:MAG: SDR family NAD(P)-dependent oxidoreductase [Planctomycetota bacterium]
MQLVDRHALVTGASRGIGAAIAARLQAEGARTILVARNKKALDELALELSAAGTRPLTFTVDLADAVATSALVPKILAECGRLDILVNNAGLAESAPLHRSSDDLWNRTMTLNLRAAIQLSRAAASVMQEAGWGRIVNIASTAAQKGYAYTAAYTASKHGLLGFARAQAVELAASGVTVNSVCPGYVDTPMTARTLANIMDKTGCDRNAAIAALASDSPLGRLVTPEEVAAAVMSFLGPNTGATTGQALGVAGGAVAP